MTSPPSLIQVKAGEFARAVGSLICVDVEFHIHPEKVDHVWVDIDCGVPLRIAVNTFSRRNLEAGFDSRVRLGLVRTVYDELPETGVNGALGLDYGAIEKTYNVFYEHWEKSALERLLLDKARSAVLVEAWGDYYAYNRHRGLHQIHSRHASCAVADDINGRDGAIQFYYGPDHIREMMLFKFCGQ